MPEPQSRIVRSLQVIVRLALAATIVPVSLCGAVWAVLFRCPVLATFFFATAALALAAVAFRRCAARCATAAVVLALLMAFAWRTPVREVNRSIARLAAIPRAEGARDRFSFPDKIAIYGLNVAMGGAGMAVYPEVARETLWLTIPTRVTEHGQRVFQSDFPMRSPRISAVVRSFEDQLADTQSAVAALPRRRIAWPPGPAWPGETDSRARLALNPCDVSATARRERTAWILDVAVAVRVAYPRQARTCVLREPELCVEEGLFWVLQESHWLHPYTAVWTFTRSVPLRRSPPAEGQVRR